VFLQRSDQGLCVYQVRCGGPAGQARQGTELASKLPDSPLIGGQQKAGHMRLMCTECGLCFRGRRQLVEHKRARHGDKRLACEQCQCTFVSSSGLKEHVKHIHDKLARYQCETCGKGYSIRSNYYDHLATHSGTRRNTCPMCQKQFIYRHSLKTHMLHFHPSEVTRM